MVKADSRARTLLADESRREELRRQSTTWPSWTVAGDPLTSLECLMSGFLWPLRGYTAPDSSAVPEADVAPELGILLEVPAGIGSTIAPGGHLVLRDPEGVVLAILRVDHGSPRDGRLALAGPIEGVELPVHDDFAQLRLTPSAVAERTRALGFGRVLAYFPGEVLPAGVRAALVHAADRENASLLLLIGSRSAEHDDLQDFARVRALEISAGLLPRDRTVVAVVPMPGSEDPAVTLGRSALIARNCGASTLAVDLTDYPSEAVATVRGWNADRDLSVVTLRPWAYSETRRRFVDAEHDTEAGLRLPPTAAEILSAPAAMPDWVLSDEERRALERVQIPRHAQGFTVFFTGLSGSGKSTIARALRVRLMELTGRPVSLLDGDRVRRHLSSELGYSREHRNLNVLRIGWVAAEITRHHGIAICAPIAPYHDIRHQVRRMIEQAGGFLLVHVATPLDTCEARDRKGLYARARAGLIPQFTGISDAYEPPPDAALTVDTRTTSVEDACTLIVGALTSRGYLVQS